MDSHERETTMTTKITDTMIRNAKPVEIKGRRRRGRRCRRGEGVSGVTEWIRCRCGGLTLAFVDRRDGALCGQCADK